MNEYSEPPAGKINVHGNGFGAATPEQIEKRAREIAMIDERNPEEFTDEDWNEARRELLGNATPNPPEEDENTSRMQEEWEVTPDDHGHRVPRPGVSENEETIGEHLVTDGVEEATHDQMLEARKEEIEQEGDIT